MHCHNLETYKNGFRRLEFVTSWIRREPLRSCCLPPKFTAEGMTLTLITRVCSADRSSLKRNAKVHDF